MLNITDLKEEQKLAPLLRLGFRPLFLLGASFSLIAMVIWLLNLHGILASTPLNGVFWWHSHEMLFGFVPAIVAGFLLTAVQSWTGIPGVKGKKLLMLVLVWIAARILILANPPIPFAFIMIIDLLFLPLAGFLLAQPLIKIGQHRNMIFLPVIALMTLMNVFTYLPRLGFSNEFYTQGIHAMVLLTTFLVAFLGGRVIPMFTANGTKTQKVLPIKWLEMSALTSIAIIFIFIAAGLTEYNVFLGVVCFIGAALHLYRNMRWRPWVTLKVPLVWSLHATMLFIPIGLLLLGTHFIFGLISFSAALHSLTVGVMGGMIIAMMSRVSLGHTGRPLQVGSIMILAFVSIVIAAITRSLLIFMLPEFAAQLWLLSGALWCFTFACFIWIYLPILSSPRTDGRPG